MHDYSLVVVVVVVAAVAVVAVAVVVVPMMWMMTMMTLWAIMNHITTNRTASAKSSDICTILVEMHCCCIRSRMAWKLPFGLKEATAELRRSVLSKCDQLRIFALCCGLRV